MTDIIMRIRHDAETEKVAYPPNKIAEALSAGVGGFYQAIPLTNALTMWVDEDGKAKNLPYNPIATGWVNGTLDTDMRVLGNVMITGGVSEDGDTLPLSETQIAGIEMLVSQNRPATQWEDFLVPPKKD